MYQQTKSFWDKALYRDVESKPTTAAPVKTLAKPYSQYFAQIRKSILSLENVNETQEFFTATWKWTWSYEINSRKLLYLHPCEDAVIATFIISQKEELKLLNSNAIDTDMKQAIRHGRNARNVRWVFYNVTSPLQVQNLLDAITLKHKMLSQPRKVRQVEAIVS